MNTIITFIEDNTVECLFGIAYIFVRVAIEFI